MTYQICPSWTRGLNNWSLIMCVMLYMPLSLDISTLIMVHIKHSYNTKAKVLHIPNSEKIYSSKLILPLSGTNSFYKSRSLVSTLCFRVILQHYFGRKQRSDHYQDRAKDTLWSFACLVCLSVSLFLYLLNVCCMSRICLAVNEAHSGEWKERNLRETLPYAILWVLIFQRLMTSKTHIVYFYQIKSFIDLLYLFILMLVFIR